MEKKCLRFKAKRTSHGAQPFVAIVGKCIRKTITLLYVYLILPVTQFVHGRSFDLSNRLSKTYQ